ncbi:S8 family serine peptidase [Synechococcus sp. EJ6-Ellesmere]|uniref:S8 family serine peptidase n=1 Tax=Synechococcus sp. EJ6-Ellesmere TaxID=2823734 RepID=UPI0020CCA9C7|nr:S8 family serine peptidase [Synechococcus sp. EJ6-Ellesmere]MCP9824942.1 S8 family serine peptidase [Synechococcus sp. EJ6-Ellesmere]
MGQAQGATGQARVRAAIPGLSWELEADSLAPSSQASGGDDPSQNLLVQWRPHTTAASRGAIHRELGGTVLRSIHTLPMELSGEGVLDVVQAPPGADARERLLRAYGQRPEVTFAEPDGQVGIQLVSNDPSLGSLWGMQSTGYGTKATTAWENGVTGTTNTVVGIVDTGIDYTHPDLYLNIWLNQGEIKGLGFFNTLVDTDSDGLITFRDLNNSTNRTNSTAKLTDWNANGYIDAGDLLDNRSGWEDGLDNDGNGYRDDLIGWDFVNNDNDPYDDNNHGTHVAGTIGGVGGNGEGVVGVNWQVQMAALKFLSSSGSGSVSNAVLAVDYFTTAKIQAGQRDETGQFVGTNNSWGGGGYSSALANAINRANQQDLLFIAAAGNNGSNNASTANYPSNYTSSNVIAVAAITSSGDLASYSNYGAVTVDLGAPGSAVYSTVRGGYASYNGTSMATPHVTGAAALLKSAYPTASAAQIKQALLDSAAPTTSLSGKTVSGGRLDSAAALDRLGTLVGPPTPPPGPSLPVVSVAASDAAAAEAGEDPGSFTFTRSGGDLAQALLVNFSLGGTATSGLDYTPGLGTSISFASNQTTATLTITPMDDTEVEGPETLTLTLVADAAYSIGTALATITIADNDSAAPPSPIDLTLWGTTANDTITGSSGDDRLAGVPATGTGLTNLGRGQIDTLTGGAGRDTFLLADSRGTFYTDGSRRSQGTRDYALVTDFNSNEDSLQLKSGYQYLSRFSNGATEIYLGNGDNRFNSSDELIARLQGVNLTPASGVYILGTSNSWTAFV